MDLRLKKDKPKINPGGTNGLQATGWTPVFNLMYCVHTQYQDLGNPDSKQITQTTDNNTWDNYFPNHHNTYSLYT